MFRSVLLCYDGTREARDALQTGAELVASLNAAAHVLVVGELTNTAWTLGQPRGTPPKSRDAVFKSKSTSQ